MSDLHNPTLFSRTQAAEYLGVSVATIDRMIHDKNLTGTFRVRGVRRIPLASITAMIDRATPRTRRKRTA